jgi:pimeloyl-ACP methyl ester carboxylesterase
MRRRFSLSLAFTALAAAVFLQSSPTARPQNPGDPSDELIETADGVKLRGIFYKATNSKNGSCVILIHEPFTDPTKGDWDGLARTLAKKGYHTLRFDFRGHGKSKDLIPEKFWREQLNTTLPGANRKPLRDTIEEKDFKTKSSYYPQLVYDLAAVRNHLDKLNDDGQVNTSSTYLIGDGDAATLGMMFLATEWHREQKKPMGFLNTQKFWVSANMAIAAGNSPAGRDYGGAVWLTPSMMRGFSTNEMKNWVSTHGRGIDGDMRKETPMLFIYGEKDSKGQSDAKTFNDQIMVAAGRGSRLEKLDSTYIRERKGTDLKGVGLLGKDDTLGTEKLIVEFLDKMEEFRRKKVRITRDYTEPVKINLASFSR